MTTAAIQREISLENVNSKLAIAQETIRRLLAEKNGNGGEKSMVDLGMVSFEVGLSRRP